MASKRPSLLELAQNGSTSSRDDVVTLKPADVPPLSPAKQPRSSQPHMSLYVGKAVQRELKQIALEYDRRPHDVLIEAVDLVLARYGRAGVAELSKRD